MPYSAAIATHSSNSETPSVFRPGVAADRDETSIGIDVGEASAREGDEKSPDSLWPLCLGGAVAFAREPPPTSSAGVG